MNTLVKAFIALMLVSGLSLTASAQVAKSTGVPNQQPAGTVIVNQAPTTQSAPAPYPTATPVPYSYPSQGTQTVYNGANATQVQQIDNQLAQLQQQERQIRDQERALRQQRAQLTGQQHNANQSAQARHDNGKHLGWYKNGKANGARAHGHEQDGNDD
jgi:hypothetical protein